jgi:hypothetical protein
MKQQVLIQQRPKAESWPSTARRHKCQTCKKMPEKSNHEWHNAIPPVVREVLLTSGQPLDADTRAFMEPRFRHDFSRVRVHTDEKAAKSANAVNAQAYAVGSSVVFGAGKYDLHKTTGKELLAHELEHIIQQETSGPRLQRRSIFQEIKGLFRGDDIPEQELLDYLEFLDKGKIEDNTDSDNKARAIVKVWRLGGGKYVLTDQRKALLIREMQSGACGDDDENAILEILERSHNFELSHIFGAGGVSAKKLYSDFNGHELDLLMDLFQRRFEGGMEALRKGEVHPVGDAVPLGIDLKEGLQLPFPGAAEGWNEGCVLGILCSKDRGVVNQLSGFVVKACDSIDVDRWTFTGGQWRSEVVHPKGFASKGENKLIGIKRDKSCEEVAQTFVHEVRHQGQQSGQTKYKREVDAYTYAENWAITRGLPGHSDLRKMQGEKVVPDPARIDLYVRHKYGAPEATPGDELVGHNEKGESVVERPDGSNYTREPKEGEDVYLAMPPRLIKEREIPKQAWRCPSTKD